MFAAVFVSLRVASPCAVSRVLFSSLASRLLPLSTGSRPGFREPFWTASSRRRVRPDLSSRSRHLLPRDGASRRVGNGAGRLRHDRFMHLVGLHGKSFTPCAWVRLNVAAVLGARVVESRRNGADDLPVALRALHGPSRGAGLRLAAVFGEPSVSSPGPARGNIPALALRGSRQPPFLNENPCVRHGAPLYHRPTPDDRTVVWARRSPSRKAARSSRRFRRRLAACLFPDGKVETSILARFGHPRAVRKASRLDWNVLTALLTSMSPKETSSRRCVLTGGDEGAGQRTADGAQPRFGAFASHVLMPSFRARPRPPHEADGKPRRFTAHRGDARHLSRRGIIRLRSP